jgi:PAS domain S-box-containing protein
MSETESASIKVGYGLGKGDDSFATGVHAAQQAVADLSDRSLSAVLVFASIRYDLEELLRGIFSVVGDAPILGATTAGEICNGPRRESVVVVVLACPYLKVQIGVGEGVSGDWEKAVTQAVSGPELLPYFSSPDNTIWQDLTRQGKAAFGLLFSPGNTRYADSHSYCILEKLKRLSEGRLPIFGGAAADDWRMETNYVLYDQRAYPDSVLVAVFETSLQFGTALAHGFSPSDQQATASRVRGHEVLELDGLPAAQVYAQMLGNEPQELEGKHLTLTSGRPLGSPDPYGQYTINVASYFTSEGGVRLTQPVFEGTALTVMQAEKDKLIAAGQEALRKALLRGQINEPAAVFVFSCALRHSILGERVGEEIFRMTEMVPDVPVVGFYSFGEQGLADDRVNRHNNEVISVLVIGQKPSYAAKVALENKRLRKELEQRIIERKQAEGALRESEERYRSFLQNFQGIAYRGNMDFTPIFFHGAVEAITGYTENEFTAGNLKWDEIIHSDDLCKLAESFEKIRTVPAYSTMREYRILRKDGEIRWVHEMIQNVYDRSGEPIMVQGVIYDITDRKRAEETLHKYKHIVSTTSDLLSFLDTNYVYQTVNEAYLKAHKKEYEEIVGHTIAELHGSEVFNDVIKDEVDRCLAGEEINYQAWFDYLGSGRRFMDVIYSPCFDEKGSVTGVVVNVRDITERKRAEGALSAEKERLRVTLRSVGDGVITTDGEGKVTLMSKVAEELTGWTQEEAIGKPLDEVFHIIDEKTRKRCENPTGKILQTGGIIGLANDTVLIARDGTEKVITDSSAAILDAEEQTIGVVLVFRDITEKRRVEARLMHAQKMEAVGTLAGGVAHDFNNLLQAVQGYADLLALKNREGESGYRELHGIVKAAHRGRELTQQLLTFSRKIESKLRPLDLNLEVDKATKLLERTIPKMIDIELHLADGLGAVNGDPVQIEQILVNLAINAKDAMPDGGKLIIQTENVTLDEMDWQKDPEIEPGKYVLLTVSDTGLGINKETLDRIFEPFFTTKGLAEGTGLGLAMVHGIVQSHGGHITCSSKPNIGTTFRIYFPAREQEVEFEKAIEANMLQGGNETILMVDDEEFIRELGEQTLTAFGYKVVTAVDGETAVEIYRREKKRIDLVILDLIMPGMGGKRTLEELLKIDPKAKVVISSGYSEIEPIKQTIEAGAKSFISKPYEITQILKVVREVLDL